MFDYDKWLRPKLENKTVAMAIPAILAISSNENSQNSQNSRSHPVDFKNLDLNFLRTFLGEDWDLYKDNPKALKDIIYILEEHRLMENGQIPEKFTAITHCVCCGDVFVPPELVNGGNVLSCMWCSNRLNGLPIPKPREMTTI